MKLTGWKTISSEEKYKNPWVSLREDIVHYERGQEHSFAVLDLPEGASVLAIDPEEHVYLVKQFRYGRNAYTIETPGGQIDPGETPEETAVRETQEELGITVEELVPLGAAAGLTSNLNHLEYLYLAKLSEVPDITTGIRKSEEEVIEVLRVPFDQAVAWALDSTIVHSLAVILILRAKEYLKN